MKGGIFYSFILCVGVVCLFYFWVSAFFALAGVSSCKKEKEKISTCKFFMEENCGINDFNA